MSISYRIRCDACQNERLYGRAHLTVGVRPAFQGSPRDLHFCDEACLARFSNNITAMRLAHADAVMERSARK